MQSGHLWKASAAGTATTSNGSRGRRGETAPSREYIKDHWRQEDRKRGKFTPSQSRKACRQFSKEDGGRWEDLIRRVDVVRPLLEKYREAKRQAERARELRNLGSCLVFRSNMETLRACIQIAVEAPAMGEAGGMIQEAAVRRPVLQDALVMYGAAGAD